jgi:hypothetical protein
MYYFLFFIHLFFCSFKLILTFPFFSSILPLRYLFSFYFAVTLPIFSPFFSLFCWRVAWVCIIFFLFIFLFSLTNTHISFFSLHFAATLALSLLFHHRIAFFLSISSIFSFIFHCRFSFSPFYFCVAFFPFISLLHYPFPLHFATGCLSFSSFSPPRYLLSPLFCRHAAFFLYISLPAFHFPFGFANSLFFFLFPFLFIFLFTLLFITCSSFFLSFFCLLLPFYLFLPFFHFLFIH